MFEPKPFAERIIADSVTRGFGRSQFHGIARTGRIVIKHQLNDGLVDRFDFFAIMEEMDNRSYLGEFELMILLTVLHLEDEAYGVPISRGLEHSSGRDVSAGSVYAALDRMENKGLISSSMGDPTPERGGKAKRYFRVTKEGMRQLCETRRVLTSLWKQLPELKGVRA